MHNKERYKYLINNWSNFIPYNYFRGSGNLTDGLYYGTREVHREKGWTFLIKDDEQVGHIWSGPGKEVSRVWSNPMSIDHSIRLEPFDMEQFEAWIHDRQSQWIDFETKLLSQHQINIYDYVKSDNYPIF